MSKIEVVVIHKGKKEVFVVKPKLRKWSTQLDVSKDLTIFIAKESKNG